MTVCILVLEQISKEVILRMGHIPKKLRWSDTPLGLKPGTASLGGG